MQRVLTHLCIYAKFCIKYLSLEYTNKSASRKLIVLCLNCDSDTEIVQILIFGKSMTGAGFRVFNRQQSRPRERF